MLTSPGGAAESAASAAAFADATAEGLEIELAPRTKLAFLFKGRARVDAALLLLLLLLLLMEAYAGFGDDVALLSGDGFTKLPRLVTPARLARKPAPMLDRLLSTGLAAGAVAEAAF